MLKMNARSINPNNASPISRESIVSAVCDIWNIDEQQLFGPSRRQPEAFARQLAMSLMYQLTRLSFMNVGKQFGRHHSTVIHAVNKVNESSNDPEIAKLITQTIKKLNK